MADPKMDVASTIETGDIKNKEEVLNPEEKETKEAYDVLDRIEEKGKQIRVQIDQLMNELKQNSDDILSQVKNVSDLEKKDDYRKEYDSNLKEFSNLLDQLIESIPKGEMQRYLTRNLRNIDLFLEVSAKKNSNDFMMLSEKRKQIDTMTEGTK